MADYMEFSEADFCVKHAVFTGRNNQEVTVGELFFTSKRHASMMSGVQTRVVADHPNRVRQLPQPRK